MCGNKLMYGVFTLKKLSISWTKSCFFLCLILMELYYLGYWRSERIPEVLDDTRYYSSRNFAKLCSLNYTDDPDFPNFQIRRISREFAKTRYQFSVDDTRWSTHARTRERRVRHYAAILQLINSAPRWSRCREQREFFTDYLFRGPRDVASRHGDSSPAWSTWSPLADVKREAIAISRN